MHATPPGHTPVLLEETLRLLEPHPGDVVVDLTAGLGGHSEAMAERIGPQGTLVMVDLDPDNLARAGDRLRVMDHPPAVHTVRDSFVRAPDHLREVGQMADVMLADLGFSSSQMDDPGRGFSFTAEGPLDMRLDPAGPMTAADLVAQMSERELADVIYRWGEEPLARRIARKLVHFRQAEPIRTTSQLARLVEEAYGPLAARSRMHPATRTFMALRIAVNDELGALRSLLEQIEAAAAHEGTKAAPWLRAGARVGFICFHSLEDRLVKHAFAELEKRGLARRLTKKPVTATDEELRSNPRARSAKLRVARIGGSTT